MRKWIVIAVVVLAALAAWFLQGGNRAAPDQPREDPEEAPAEGAPEVVQNESDAPSPADTESSAPPAAPRDWILTPVKVGGGPLLFATRKDETGAAVHALVDVESGRAAEAFLSHTLPVRVAGRPGTGFLLVDAGSEAFHVVDLKAATHERLLEGRPVQFIDAEGGEVFVLDREERRLLACPAKSPSAGRPLFPDRVEQVLAVSAEHVFLISEGPPKELWRVPKRTGSLLKIVEADPAWSDSWDPRWEASPGGRYLATGAGLGWKVRTDPETGESELYDGPKIVLIDALSGKVTSPAKDINTSVSPLSSGMPKLEFTFVDDRRLRFSETEPSKDPDKAFFEGDMRWIEIDVETGERLAAIRYGPLGLDHEKPPRDLAGFTGGVWSWTGRETTLLRRNGKHLWFGEEEEPAAIAVDLPGRPTWREAGYAVFDPTSRFVAALTKRAGDVVLTILDGAAREVRVVSDLPWEQFFWVRASRER